MIFEFQFYIHHRIITVTLAVISAFHVVSGLRNSSSDSMASINSVQVSHKLCDSLVRLFHGVLANRQMTNCFWTVLISLMKRNKKVM